MTNNNYSKPLTTKSINALKPKAEVYRLSDFPATGLRITVKSSGSKKWAFSYTSPITSKRMIWTFADYPAIGLAVARKRATEYRQLVIDGIDPRNQKKKQKKKAARDASLGTVKDLFDLYVADMKLDNKTSFDDVESKYKNHIHKHIGSLPANEVDIDIAADMLADISQDASINVADKCRTFCMRAWKIGLSMRSGVRWKKAEIKYGLSANPFMLIDPINQNKGIDDRYLTKEELIFIWKHAGVDVMHKQMALGLKLLISTGQRVQEVLFAEWSEFDFDSKLWVMPWQKRKVRHKVKTDLVVPLTDFHIDLLNQLKELAGDSVWVFPKENNTGEDLHRDKKAITQAVIRFCKPTKNGKWKGVSNPFPAKAARKTFKTLGAQHVKLPLEIRDRIQGHSIAGTGARVYDKYDYLEEKREAMQKWTDWLERILSGTGANIIPLGARHAN